MSCLLFISFPIIIDKILHFLLPVKDSKSVCLRDIECNAMTQSPGVGAENKLYTCHVTSLQCVTSDAHLRES